MMLLRGMLAPAAIVAVLALAPAAAAQSGAAAVATVDVAKIKLPNLSFTANARIAAGYDRFFYFHREGVDFATAYADLAECDALASAPIRRSNDAGRYSAGDFWGMSTLGGPLWHSLQVTSRTRAERVRLHSVNMRNCMRFKGYRRYGLPEAIWKQFNLDANDIRSSTPAKLVEYRQKRAKLASGPLPLAEAIAP